MRKCHNHKSTTSQSQHEETESIIRNTDFVASTRAPDKRQRAVKRDMLLAYDQWLVFLKVGTIIPHTFIPTPFFWDARIVPEKWGYDWSYVRKIRTKIQRFSDLFFGFSDHTPIIPPNFRCGYDWCHVEGMIRQIGV